MERKTPSRDPKYRKHKSGQARVTIAGKTYYLGKYGSAESKEAYNRLIAQWRSQNCTLPEPGDELTVNNLLLAYLRHAEEHYRKPDGKPTSELGLVKTIVRLVRSLFGRTAAAKFGPRALKAVREKMVERGWCRRIVNANVQRVKQIFKWATANELVPATVYHGLQAVEGLRRGRTRARESDPVRPVSDVLLQGAREHVAPQVLAMIDLQLLTAMRPGEVCTMRSCDLDTGGSVWVYRPQSHKTEHHGHAREIYLGPRAQEVVRPWLRTALEEFLFSPREVCAWRHEQMRAKRKTKVQPSQQCRKKRRPKRSPGDCYDVASYRRAIAHACRKAFPLPAELAPRRKPDGKRENQREWWALLTDDEQAAVRAWRREHNWHPHQLRHNAATELRRQFGTELARLVLGHRHLKTTEIYAEANSKQAMEVIAKIG
jgi:integrase